MNINNLWNHIKCLFLPVYTASKCGHQTKLFGPMPRNTWCQMPLEENGSPRYCLSCLEKQSVPCVYCGESIFVGEMISLIKNKEVGEYNKSPLLTVLVDNEPYEIKSYPGCSDCCEYMFLSAYLHPDKEAYYFGSVMEKVIGNPKCSAVIVSDTSRPEFTTTIIPLEAHD